MYKYIYMLIAAIKRMISSHFNPMTEKQLL